MELKYQHRVTEGSRSEARLHCVELKLNIATQTQSFSLLQSSDFFSFVHCVDLLTCGADTCNSNISPRYNYSQRYHRSG